MRTGPRVVGVAALAIATAGAVSGGSAVPSSSGSSLERAVLASSVSAPTEVQPLEVDVERPVRAPRVSRDAARQVSVPERLGTQAVDAIADAKADVAKERAAKKRAVEKRAAKKRAAKKQAAAEAAAKRWRLPVASGSYRLTAGFGECSPLWSQCHTGLDFAAPSGTPIAAVAAGTVTEAAFSGAYGNRTVVRLDDGTEMWYCHQTSFSVAPGERIAAGQTIGTVGSTGNSTGSHLHLEIHPGGGDAADPAATLAAKGVKL